MAKISAISKKYLTRVPSLATLRLAFMWGSGAGTNMGKSRTAAAASGLDLDHLRRIAAAVANLLGPHCEVVIHDFSDLEHSIVHLEGNVSNRAVGDAATDLLLSRVRAGRTDEDLHNYRTRGAAGGTLKSSTVFLRDRDGRPRGAFCVNLDIDVLQRARDGIDALLRVEERSSVSETLSGDIDGTISAVFAETVRAMDMHLPVMARKDKLALIARLDDKGMFQVKRAVPVLARAFGTSRATIYNYLKSARAGASEVPRKRGRRPRVAAGTGPVTAARAGKEKRLG